MPADKRGINVNYCAGALELINYIKERNMIQNFKFQNGELSFYEDKIVIADNDKKHYRFRLFTSGMWTIYGILSVLRYLRTGDQFLLWTGLIIGIGHFMILIWTLFLRTSKSEIRKSEILSIEMKQRFGNKFLDINLKGNKTRRINQIDNIFDELSQYIETNFPSASTPKK